jgi:glyoxylase-like metal-dependent hydrolase (beta-lactamase superfamily II)
MLPHCHGLHADKVYQPTAPRTTGAVDFGARAVPKGRSPCAMARDSRAGAPETSPGGAPSPPWRDPGAVYAASVTLALFPCPQARGSARWRRRIDGRANLTGGILATGDPNAVFLVTDEGVLVIDTRTHPRDARDLLDRIRKVTDKPVKWVINSHFHGDHQMGNSVFKAAGATFVAQKETARIMQLVHPKEMSRRIDGFRSRGYDPNEVKLVLPDVTFDSEMTIRLGGREVRLFYLGPGQQAGDTFVQFPHARVLFTPGAFAKHSMPNMAFTPSVDGWVKLLDQVAAMDVDTILPAHGDVATRADVKELAAMLADEYATVKDAVNWGVNLDQAVKTLTFPQYKDWRNYRRLDGEIRALYELIQTGKRSYLE